MSSRVGIVFVIVLVLAMSAFAQLQIKNSAATPQVLMHITQNGTVGINTTAPDAATKLDVNGKTKTATFQMTTSPVNNYVLTSDASGNATWQAASTIVEVDGVIGNEILNVTNTTLTRGGSGTSAAPYTVALNLANANSWTVMQTFNSSIRIGTTNAYTLPNTQGTSGQFLSYNGTWGTPTGTVEVDGIIGNEVTNATNATLIRAGSGTSAAPYTLALNLNSANTWTATGLQTFTNQIVVFTGSNKFTISTN